MADDLKEIRAAMAALSDVELRNIVLRDYNDYRPEAVEIAREEYRKRAAQAKEEQAVNQCEEISASDSLMVKCPGCHNEIARSYLNCPYCGQEMEKTPAPEKAGNAKNAEAGSKIKCPWCDALIPADAEFCPNCNTEVIQEFKEKEPDAAKGCKNCGGVMGSLGDCLIRLEAGQGTFSLLSEPEEIKAYVFQCQKCGKLEFFAPVERKVR